MKRKATPFKYSEDSYDYPDVRADRHYITHNFWHPEKLEIVYSEYFKLHLEKALWTKVNKRISNATSEGSSIRSNRTNTKLKALFVDLSKLFDSYLNSDAEPFASEIAIRTAELFHEYWRDGDKYFEWIEKAKLSSGFNLYNDFGVVRNVLFKYFIYNRPISQGTVFLSTISKYYLPVTQFAKNHLEEFLSSLDEVFSLRGDSMIVDTFFPGISKVKPGITKEFSKFCDECEHLYIDQNETYQSYLKDLCREADNHLRRKYNMKDVGEEWVTESEIFNAIRKKFPKLKIERHYRADWLGQQHLDLFIPNHKIAVEYQGEQHFQPVERFGGIDKLPTIVERDKRKRAKCLANGVRLLYIYPKFNITQVLDSLSSLIKHTSKELITEVGPKPPLPELPRKRKFVSRVKTPELGPKEFDEQKFRRLGCKKVTGYKYNGKTYSLREDCVFAVISNYVSVKHRDKLWRTYLRAFPTSLQSKYGAIRTEEDVLNMQQEGLPISKLFFMENRFTSKDGVNFYIFRQWDKNSFASFIRHITSLGLKVYLV